MKTKYLSLAIFICAVFLCACDMDDSFTTSPNNMLTFSTDTLRLDTVFSTVPSSTRSFWVYNRSGAGLRCKSVRLEGGNQTGFRVNVDGLYLSPEQGYKANGIEVRDKDSIRVFVELTSPSANGEGVRRIGDNIVFALESGKEQKVALNAWAWNAQFVRNLTVSEDTVLSSSRPVVVYGMLTVADGATLTIAPGTKMYFHVDAGIDVSGRLVCNGDPDAPIVLRGDRLDRMFDYLPYDRVSGQWQGIRLRENSYGNKVDYTDIHGAFDGVRVDSSDVARLTLSMAGSTVHNCQGNALGIVNSMVKLENCQLTNALGNCLMVDGGDVEANSCTLAQFYPFDAMRGSALYFSSTEHPLVSLGMSNTIVTGYADDEVMGERQDGDAAFNYNFANCVLRTPEVTNDENKNFVDVVWEDVTDTLSFGRKHFVRVDAGNQAYDFHLRKESAAVGKANAETAAKTDHDGRSRDDTPDVGAYECVKTDEKP